MKKLLPYLTAIVLLVLTGFSMHFFDKKESVKTGFIINQKVFEEFQGKKEMKMKLEMVRKEGLKELDSIKSVITNSYSEEAQRFYEEKMFALENKERNIAELYSNNLWTQINQYIQEYGKQEHYDYIYGATGSGSLMYAKDGNDITKEVIAFINKKYEGN